jgi:hypothetical protein
VFIFSFFFRPVFLSRMFFEHDSIAQCRRRLELLVLGSSQGACHPLWSQMLSHIVVKGSRSSKFVVCTGSVSMQHNSFQHAERKIPSFLPGLKYKSGKSRRGSRSDSRKPRVPRSRAPGKSTEGKRGLRFDFPKSEPPKQISVVDSKREDLIH